MRLFLIALSLLSAVATAKPAKIPMQDFFRNSQLIQVRISPDGKRLAWLAPYENRMNVFVKEIGTAAPAVRVTSITDRSIEKIYWKGNGHILFERDNAGD